MNLQQRLMLGCSRGDQFDKQRENIKRFGLSYLALQSFEQAPAQPQTTEE